MGQSDLEAPPSYDHGGGMGGYGLDNKAIRQGFIRKVFMILSVQLLVTLGIICIMILVDPIRQPLQDDNNRVLVLVPSMVVYLVLAFTLICCGQLRRLHPWNLILLFVFTLATSLMVGVVCVTLDIPSVVLAVGVTAICCGGVFIFSFNTKYDLSSMHGIVFCLLLGLLLTGLLMPIFPRIPYQQKIFAGIGALIFMFIMVYDIHRIMGKSDENAISEEEYVFAALQVYLDIINILLRMLQIFGRR